MRHLALAAIIAAVTVTGRGQGPAPQVWDVDNLARIGGHAVQVIGAPRVVATDAGPAVEFNGRTDGLLIDANPLAGLSRFTVEVLFSPDAEGPEEQRFLHIQEASAQNRALIELRLAGGRWSLDTFLLHGANQLALLDRVKTHAAGDWHVAALTFDGRSMAHYVDGIPQGSGAVAFQPLTGGRVSIGVRQNLVSWFKGRIRTIRVTSSVLAPSAFLAPPPRVIPLWPEGVPGGKAGASVASHFSDRSARGPWARGIEGQRKADLGNGTFLNPILAGDHPDPSVLKDGDDYYMTHSSFDAYPGLVVWHSKDLVNWQPVGPSLFTNVGSVWAPDLVKHGGRYYIYFPGVGPYRSNYVIWADNIRGPWSEPIDLKLERIDPGHAVGPDGRRYLFMSAGLRVPLAADGLSVTGPAEKVYDGWRYPADWVVESFSQEGPKMLRRGGFYYMVLAEGGTAGPPTGHMVVAARSRSIDGPWEHSPYNPIVRTTSADEPWWSKGHGTLVEGPGGQWYLVYHAYENGFYTLGRQTLIEPITWTDDGWFRAAGADVARPIAKPPGAAVAHGVALSDDFQTSKIGTQWRFYRGTAADRARVRYEKGSLVMAAHGHGPADSSPLGFVAGDHAYEIEVDIDADPGASAGVLLFYSSRLYAGLGFSTANFILHRYGTDRLMAKPSGLGQRIRLRLRNDRHIVTLQFSRDGAVWEPFGTAMEVSGYHHNVAGEFLSLRPAIYAAGDGEVRFRDFRYRALP